MKTRRELGSVLRAIDGRSYGAYKDTAGVYDFDGFVLHIDHVQGDPFAAPSRVRIVIPPGTARLDPELLTSRVRRVATADFLNRRLARALADASRSTGSGKSGLISILAPGQAILERTSTQVNDAGEVTVRLTAGLPARGRRILGQAAVVMLLEAIPVALRRSIFPGALETDALCAQAELAEDSAAIREQLSQQGLVAFVREGSILPRRSGVDDRPLSAERAVPFASPDSLRVTLEAPNFGAISGMGVRRGVTLIVGGGYHGKSTLLRAIERGIYDHIAGDGRELVVAVGDAVKVRAEDGRRIAAVDISNFIKNLPGGEDTREFTTENASGSTSQAAAIVEALELGATCLLIDEDTSATNFMIRDARMQALIHDGDEPITPFIDRARQLYDELGVSTVIVVGGAGDYFDIADTVIGMKAYRPLDVTERARAIAHSLDTRRAREGGEWSAIRERIPRPASIDPRKGKKAVSIKVPTRDRILFGTEEVDLSAVEQIVESGQARAIAQALAYATGRFIDGSRNVRGALTALRVEIGEKGLDVIDSRQVGDYADFRVFEAAAALGRLRSLRVEPAPVHAPAP